MTLIRRVIESRGLAPDNFTKCGLDEGRIRELLSGEEPTVDEVRIIAKFLKIPVRDLIVPVDFEYADRLLFRTNFSRVISHELELEAQRATSYSKAISEFIGRTKLPMFLDFPKSNESAEALAHIFRRDIIGLDDNVPLQNLAMKIFEKANVLTRLMHFRTLEGSSARFNDTAIILLSHRNVGRMRFSFCHEVCHLLTDLGPESSEVWLDQEMSSPKHSSNYAEEMFANAFAAAVLLPMNGVLEVLRRWRTENNAPSEGISALEVAYVARTFGTNFIVAGQRLEMLELLPSGGARALYSSINRQYRSPEKFADNFEIEVGTSDDWRSAVMLAFSRMKARFADATYSVEWMAEILGIRMEEALVRADAERNH